MLLNRIQEDLKQAQLAREETKVSTLRLLISEIGYVAIARSQDRSEVSDEQIVSVIQKEIKKRKEGAEGFRKGGREQLAQKEEAEMKVLEYYLPAQISDDDLTKIVEGTITEVGATSIKDMGKVIGSIMSKVKGQADGARVSALIKEKLT